MQMKKHSWLQVEEFMKTCDLAIIPTGATENHGTHLPLGTDTYIPEKLVEMIDPRVNAIIPPVMPFGVSDHHDGFYGTLTIGYEAFYGAMKAITDKLYRMGVRRFIVLNGHGGNDPALQRIGLELYNKGAVMAIIDWWDLCGQMKDEWKGGHAAGQETSAMMAVDPSLVYMDLAKDLTPVAVHQDLPAFNLSSVSLNGIHFYLPRDVKTHYPQGWSGADLVKDANAQWGKDMLDATADFVVELAKKLEEIKL